uniref:Tenomodulin n=1 Tax=Labrus bergylta TaxID=56723 RepID=A0A3Q3GVF0_9LABR
MEAASQSSSQQILWKDVEAGKEKKAKFYTYQRLALVLALVLVVMGLCVFSLRFLWSPSQGKLYDHQYKAVLDGVETDSMMEIDPGQHIEIFRMGNGSEEVLEVHDFKNGITGIRFAEHQRCYIRTQTRKLPVVAEAEAEHTELVVNETKAMDTKMDNSEVWVPAEEPIVNPAFLFDSKIWEICQELPIHWIHPSPLRLSLVMCVIVTLPAPVCVLPQRDVGIELDNRLDDQGYCCQHCRRGYRFCRRYHEPLGGFNPWPYYYQGGRVICQIVMPCNWWIARMLGRI